MLLVEESLKEAGYVRATGEGGAGRRAAMEEEEEEQQQHYSGKKAPQRWRILEGRCVDAVRWMPPATAWHRMLALALWNADTGKSQLELAALQQESASDLPALEVLASLSQPARISSLKVSSVYSHHALLAAASYSGSVSFFVTDLLQPVSSTHSLTSPPLHKGPVSGMDLQSNTKDCVSVGEDGKISLLKLAEAQLQRRCMYDSQGFTSFRSVCWASPMEFVTAGLGFCLQWWDHRRPGGAVSQSPTKWASRKGAGIIHSIDVHSSRKHVCVVGGSGGSVLAWDLRWQQEPVLLSNPPPVKGQQFSVGEIVESDVWEVKFDPFMLSRVHGGASSKMPVMVCSEDGVLAVLEAGEVPLEILAEPCAINTFDIDLENDSDVVCGLEYESLLYLRRHS